METYQIAIIVCLVAAVLVVLGFMLKGKKKGNDESPVDLDKLFGALGGKENVDNVEPNGSKVKVFLKDDSLLDADALKALGATGVVSTSQATNIIFGKVSENIVKAMKNNL